jgi:hypothetical protein
VLKGILQHADEGIIPLLEDTIDAVFNCLDNYHSSAYAPVFLKILCNIVVVFGKIKTKHDPQIDQEANKRHAYLLQIMEKVQHFAASKSREVRILVQGIQPQNVY